MDQGRIVLDVSMARLAQCLHMGVAASEADLPAATLHREPLGAPSPHAPWAWVARRESAPDAPDAPAAPVQLELLYKALSLAPQALLAAIGDEGAETGEPPQGHWPQEETQP